MFSYIFLSFLFLYLYRKPILCCLLSVPLLLSLFVFVDLLFIFSHIFLLFLFLYLFHDPIPFSLASSLPSFPELSNLLSQSKSVSFSYRFFFQNDHIFRFTLIFTLKNIFTSFLFFMLSRLISIFLCVTFRSKVKKPSYIYFLSLLLMTMFYDPIPYFLVSHLPAFSELSELLSLSKSVSFSYFFFYNYHIFLSTLLFILKNIFTSFSSFSLCYLASFLSSCVSPALEKL